MDVERIMNINSSKDSEFFWKQIRKYIYIFISGYLLFLCCNLDK